MKLVFFHDTNHVIAHSVVTAAC